MSVLNFRAGIWYYCIGFGCGGGGLVFTLLNFVKITAELWPVIIF